MQLLDYLASEFATFDEKPPCTADSLVLTQLAMVEAGDAIPGPHDARPETGAPSPLWRRALRHLSGTKEDAAPSRARAVGPRDLLLAEHFATMFTGPVPDDIKRVLFGCAASPRFRTLEIANRENLFDPRRSVQFAAMTFTHRDSFTYVAFRGTDTSYTGWREDLSMGFSWPVPSQTEAARYLETVARSTDLPLIVGGHSKGGNLAVYAAVKAPPDVRDRIVRVYNHDGPGFRREAFDDGAYAPLADRVSKTVPPESVVGVLLQRSDDFKVVKSASHGLDQHSVFNWMLDPATGEPLFEEGLSDSSAVWHATVQRWVDESTVEELEGIVDALFSALEASGEPDASTLLGGGPKALATILESARNMDDKDRSVLARAFGALAGASARSVGDHVAGKMQQAAAMRSRKRGAT